MGTVFKKIAYFSCLLSCFLAAKSPILGDAHSFSFSAEGENKNVWVNVFIHGIISVKPLVTLSNFPRFFNDNFEDSPYALTIKNIRKNSFFYQNQTIQAPGLQPIDIDNCPKGAAACITARIFEKTDKLSNPDTRNLFYTYGWSALLSREARLHDAYRLFLELNREMDYLRAQGYNPKLRLIGYSHGGTVAILLALIKRLYNFTPHFKMDELYLMGTPIQTDTDYLITDPLFGKIYNIFSRGDRFQKMDCFSSGQFFSQRVFSTHCGLPELPEKLTQIEIKITRPAARSNCGCWWNGCWGNCPCTPSYKRMRNVSPGHSELWFYGWTMMHYRKTFPLYPLPIAAILPAVINAVKPLEASHLPGKPFVVTIDMATHQMNIRNTAYCDDHTTTIPFISASTLNAFKQEALSYRPDPNVYNWDTFNAQIHRATVKAYIQRRLRRCGN